MNILFVGIHKELIDAYDKQIDVARKMINQFSIGIRIDTNNCLNLDLFNENLLLKKMKHIVSGPKLSKD